MRPILVLGGIAVLAAAAFPVLASGDQPQRYVMSPADGGGVIRLDTLTGAMALCRSGGGQWACDEMEDKTAALRADNDRLRAENEALKTENRRLEEMVLPEAKPGQPPEARSGKRLELPSEEDVDKAMTYLGRMFRKFRDKLKEFEDDGRGTPL